MAKRHGKPTRAVVEYPVCVRHLKPRKDVRLRHFFLCNSYATQWGREALAGNKSVYDGERITGYCLLCNRKKQVRLRTWFLCDICARVAGSIGRNHVAEDSILDFWRDKVVPLHPYLQIRQNDVSALRPRRETDASGEGPIDFLVTDTRIGAVVFGIENKTGRSAISEMSAFQLDVSDCDAILYDARRLGIPAYVIHAQVLEIWEPPTVGFRTFGLWWSDIYEMAEHFREVRTRKDEQRGAAYFGKKAFAEISTLPSALVDSCGNLVLVERFKAEGLPAMYRQP